MAELFMLICQYHHKTPTYMLLFVGQVLVRSSSLRNVFFCEVMTDEQKARLSTKRPLTKEEYEARQSVIRRVVDPETGRTR